MGIIILMMNGFAGERTKDKKDILQRLQETSATQSITVQSWKGKIIRTR